ncbi:MAG TPA: ATP-dependent DNA helicase [Actinomycetota bacterium]|nr:ATP-dependent DNA helicase [Actinomycetota bacterium]
MTTVPDEVVQAMRSVPTPEQWRAISMPLEPYVIVAGAGSGKTSVIAARVVYLALVALGRVRADHDGVLPGNVLCLTFTNKATENLQLRIRKALAALDLPEGEEPAVLNYHGFAAQVLDRHGLLAGIEPGQRILTSAQRAELCARVLDEMTFEHVKDTWQPSLIDKILTLADQAANHRVTPAEIIAWGERRREELRSLRSERTLQAAEQRIELARAVQRFEELKRDLGAIDFGDQITLALDVVERFPEVVQEYRERFSSVVLDEYQDTNVAQAQLIAAVFGDGFPVAAVGDPDQNIYAWRGASLYNLIQFQHQFPKGDGSPSERLPLYTNFRSGARILGAADRVIAPLPPAQRPDPDKKLDPWQPNGDGEVTVVRLPDEWTEATWIAERILELRGAHDLAWSDVAVLCRKSRLFVPLQQAFARAHIPVEIVGLSGLLKLPEVVEVLAYARAVANPFASVSLARILLGPRYRVGFKDLARVAAWAKDRNYALRDRGRDLRGEDEEDTPPFLFAEALEHLDEVEYLSEEGRRRLEEFRAELAALRAEARRPVGEFLSEVIRRIGLLAELNAHPDVALTAATNRNLAAFLDEVEAFSPLEGELTLRAFLDYVDLVESIDRPEWSPVQPSDDDSVKVMTIHQAKGLEFDTVFVPGLARDLLPDFRVQHNPAEKGKSLDFELRGDSEILPAFKGNLKQFWYALRDQALIEERRTCYVALTRAQRRLLVSGAHWYGDDVSKPKPASVFLEELADWGEEMGTAMVDRGEEPAEENPLAGYREQFVRDWPGPALRVEADGLFPSGWRAAAAKAAAEQQPTLFAPARAGDTGLVQERLALAAHLLEVERRTPERPRAPATVAVGGVIEYARCPKRFYWSSVQPLPRFSGPAARIGTQIHSWIERQSSGQASLLELDEAPDLTTEELAGEPGRAERLQRAFLDSRFAGVIPLHAERPFLLQVGPFTISGRIDAIYGTPEGRWEIVDYKTGKPPRADDELAGLQLDLYALAATEVWGKDPADLTLTYLYLSSAEEDSRPAGDLELVRKRVIESLTAMSEGRFEPTPGPQCRWCDFLSFCRAGRDYVGSE